jgi:serine/threonine protein kinase
MGIVYKARQIRAGRLVALKTIHAPHLAGAEQVRRFQGEAAAAARLNHHGIVPVYDVGEHNGLHYFSMGFVDGPNLEIRARAQILSCREAAAICRDLAEALEYAHRNGVIHRDVKPHNVLIGPDGKPRLMDFGLAKLIDQNQDLTGTGQVMGTAAYMAPEQARGLRTVVEPTIDVYSLGATLYRCVTGRPPFQASTTIEVLRQLNEDEPVSPRRLNQEVDVEIETLCLKCLEKEPSRRFQSAGELAAELNRYLNREPIQSRPISAAARAWRWCLRRPASAGIGRIGSHGCHAADGDSSRVSTNPAATK